MVLRADHAVIPTAGAIVVRGANCVAKGAMAAVARARFTGTALIDGTVGLAMAPYGRLRVVLTFVITDAGITEIDVIAQPDRLEHLDIAVLDVPPAGQRRCGHTQPGWPLVSAVLMIQPNTPMVSSLP